MNKMGVGETVKKLRLERNLSKRKAAKISGVNRGRIHSIENGQDSITVKTARALAKAYRVPISRILDEEEPIALQVLKLPILGSVPCGVPFPVEEYRGEEIEIPQVLIEGSRRENLFAFQASGDSLIGNGIQDGDKMRVISLRRFLTYKTRTRRGSRLWSIPLLSSEALNPPIFALVAYWHKTKRESPRGS